MKLNMQLTKLCTIFMLFNLFHCSSNSFYLIFYLAHLCWNIRYIVHNQLLYLCSATSSTWNNSETWLFSYSHNYTTQGVSQRLSHVNNSFSFWDTEKRLKQSCLILRGLLRDGKHFISNKRVVVFTSVAICFEKNNAMTITISKI